MACHETAEYFIEIFLTEKEVKSTLLSYFRGKNSIRKCAIIASVHIVVSNKFGASIISHSVLK